MGTHTRSTGHDAPSREWLESPELRILEPPDKTTPLLLVNRSVSSGTRQHFLYLIPLPQGHGAFRDVSLMRTPSLDLTSNGGAAAPRSELLLSSRVV
jgi:hypothetical protein